MPTVLSLIDIIVVDKNNVETVIGSRFVVMPDKMNQWQTLYDRNPQWIDDPFYFLHATSAASTGGAGGLAQAYESYVSPTMRGVRVPILYMRTTFGKEKSMKMSQSMMSHNQQCCDPLKDCILVNTIIC